jgi:hypothetical protein
MLCEKCHQAAALVHITEMEGAGRSAAAPSVRWNLCEPCGSAYGIEMNRFLERFSPRFNQSMSKQESAQAMLEFRDRMRKHMADWVAGRLSP